MLRGQRSRTSKTNGTRFSAASHSPAMPVRNCGEVAMTTSGRPVSAAPTVLALAA